MIVFGGIDLTGTIPVMIEDVVVSPIQLNTVARQRPIQYGAEYVRTTGGTRTVTITFALLEINPDEREKAMQNLRDWAKIGKTQTMVLPQFSDRFLSCTCTQLPDYSYRKWWENKLRAVFTCFDNPFWTSAELLEVPCGQTFSVGGSAPPLMQIVRNGSAINNVTYATSNAAMTFKKIPSGTFTIDLNRQTADVGGVSVMSNYTPTSVWIVPQTGKQKITGTGTVKYRERWV